VAFERLRDELVTSVRERPYWTGALLCGVGWMMGRTLPVRAVVTVASFGARTALLATMETAILDRLRPLLQKETP